MTLYEEIKNGIISGIEANENNIELRENKVSLPDSTEESKEIKEN